MSTNGVHVEPWYMFRERVEKMKKTQHVRSTTDRRNPDLCGYLYLPLDRRKQRHESVLLGIHRRKRGVTDGNEMNDLPCSDYERMYQT